MSDMSLDDLRSIVDGIDVQIVDLLNRRATAALKIGNVKQQLSKQAYDPTRERAVLNKINRLNVGPLSKGSLEEIYAAIITACREIQIR